ncbi:MAG: dicarboxylate/amino acid:cation symporter [Erysipelotrichaceae bacterium]|nr:dicarboxylate/amino acid:cation symporter [Erysipelotrichaceae bacterium]
MKKNLSIYTLIALFAGIIAGLFGKEYVGQLSFIGTIYINILKFLIAPVVFTSIASTIYASQNRKDKLLGKAVGIYMAMFLATYILMSILVVICDPAKGFSFPNTEWNGVTQDLSIQEIIINLFPSNIVSIFLETKLFAIIMFAYMLGICASKVEDGDKLIRGITIAKNVFFKILEYVMYLTPFAVFSLIANTIATYGTVIIGVGLRYIAMAYLGGLFTLIFIMILPVSLIAKISPLEYIRKVYKVWLVSLTTCSSAATLPTTMKVCKEEFGVDEKIVDVVSPLGCTIHMCGGAVSFALLGLFCSSMYGIKIDIFTYLLMMVSSLLINMSAPGIPNGGVVIGATYLELLSIPLDFIGFYSGLYKILDMLYTTLNVTGNITANVIIAALNKGED